MKIDLNDPRITAFALGELKGQDAIEIARAVRMDKRVREAVDEVRGTASLLMETIGGDETHLLTPAQREAVRSVGGGSVIADISSAKVPFWKNPAVAGIGVAAVVAIGFYVVGGRPGNSSANGVADSPPPWDWSQVDMEYLTAPAVLGVPGGEGDVHPVSAAMRDDTAGFHKEVERRIEQGDIRLVSTLPELADHRWTGITPEQRLNIPLVSGASSWPWVRRYIEEEKTRPPRQAVRIEEMVNYFRYKKPTMIKGGGLIADMELCQTPWNPLTLLLAVHTSPDAEGRKKGAGATLSLNSNRVKRARLLGYSAVNSTQKASVSGPSFVSRSHGNYTIYELELLDSDSTTQGSLATLNLGSEGDNLSISRVASWIHASPDLRFASVVSATGMLLTGTSSEGELDVRRLLSLVDLISKQDAAVLGGDRRDALKVIRHAAGILEAAEPE